MLLMFANCLKNAILGSYIDILDFKVIAIELVAKHVIPYGDQSCFAGLRVLEPLFQNLLTIMITIYDLTELSNTRLAIS